MAYVCVPKSKIATLLQQRRPLLTGMVIEDDSWREDESLRHCTSDALAKLGRRFMSVQDGQKRVTNPLTATEISRLNHLGYLPITKAIGFIRRVVRTFCFFLD
jgi:hypothetical protein